MELPMPTAAAAFIPVESSDESLPPGTGDDLRPFSDLPEHSNTPGPKSGIGLGRRTAYPLPKGCAGRGPTTGAEARETEAATSVSHEGIRRRFFANGWFYIYMSRRHHGDEEANSLAVSLLSFLISGKRI
ncbi:hypothetical protein GQ457_15G025570 [Hibiscus cannabinus]